MRGVEVSVTLDSTRFAGDGDLDMFGGMLNRFLALYATLNLYTKLVVISQPSGARIEWPETKPKQTSLGLTTQLFDRSAPTDEPARTTRVHLGRWDGAAE